MKINKAQRDRARKKTTMEYEAVDSSVSTQKVEAVREPSDKADIVSRSGVIVKARQMYGQSAIQKAKDLLGSENKANLQRPKTVRDAGEEWFKANQGTVQQMIKEPIQISKNKQEDQKIKLGGNFSHKYPIDFKEEIEQPPIDFENYRPPVDEVEEYYIPKSER